MNIKLVHGKTSICIRMLGLMIGNDSYRGAILSIVHVLGGSTLSSVEAQQGDLVPGRSRLSSK